MTSVDETPKPSRSWKLIALRSFSFGVGFSIVWLVTLGLVYWYVSRPEPEKPWIRTALVVKDAPRFSLSSDGKRIDFSYVVENTTNSDYRVGATDSVQVLIRLKDGSFSQPLSAEVAALTLPVFLPAKQKGTMELSMAFGDLPGMNANETDLEFHERIRAFLQGKDYSNLDGFVLFDETHRYQILFGRWLSKPKDAAP